MKRTSLRAVSAFALAVAALLAAACVADDPVLESPSARPSGPEDAATVTDAGAATDAGATVAEAGACDPSLPFGPRVKLGGDVNTSTDEYPGRLSHDGALLAFVRRMSASDLDIFVANRGGSPGSYVGSAAVAAVSSPSLEAEPSFGDDAGLLVFASNRGAAATFTLYASRRAPDGGFQAPTALSALDSPGEEREPYLVADGRALYFARGGDLFVSTRNGDGSFGTAVSVPGPINTGDVEGTPVVTDDERILYFKRTSNTTSDIFRATRAAREQPFGVPVPVTELNTALSDLPAWVSADDCTMIVAENPDGGTLDLFVAQRPASP